MNTSEALKNWYMEMLTLGIDPIIVINTSHNSYISGIPKNELYNKNVVINIGREAIRNLYISESYVKFSCSFNGVPVDIVTGIESIEFSG